MEKIKLDKDTRFALEGRVVTLDANSNVIDKGVLYIQGDTITDLRRLSDPAPEGFSKHMIIKTGGTIYPGLIELHNHLSYNIIPTWQVPRLFLDRDQWRRHEDYRKKMTGPLEVLGAIDGYLQSIVRFAECRLLFSGITTSQGITLASHQEITKFYKGIVRNVEKTDDPDLPEARTRIDNINNNNAEKLLELLKHEKCYLLHLSEGTQLRANKHFRALQISQDEWAITEALAGIHAVGLLQEDFEIMAGCKGSIVWSPMSNFLLYGVTADIVSANQNKLLIGLGSDWSASGSKNLLCELKVARLVSEEMGGIFSDQDLVRMVTTNASRILKWENYLGSLEPKKKADLIVLRGRKEEPYKKLIDAREQDLTWVFIGGWPRIGQKSGMEKFDIEVEEVKIGSVKRYLYLVNEYKDNPVTIDLSYKEAREKLEEGMRNLPDLAKQQSEEGLVYGSQDTSYSNYTWHILPDHEDHPDSSQRHHLPYESEMTGGDFLDQAAIPLCDILEPMELDQPTISDDPLYFKKLAVQKNLPEYIKLKLPKFYGQEIDLSDIESQTKNLTNLVRSNFNFIQSLPAFYQTHGYLSLQDRLTIIDQAAVLLEQAYVHLHLKRAMHASDPKEQLRILRNRIQEEDNCFSEIEFHKEIIRIFNSLRDLHTTYYLPAPFSDKVAFLPFFIEEYFDGNEARYIVSKFIGKPSSLHFREKVIITHWNNIPIQRAIMLNGERFAGSNPAARFARGLDSMTFRPLAMILPPEEESVTIEYKDIGTWKRRITIPWLVGSIHSSRISTFEKTSISNFQLFSGYDYLTHLVHHIKKCFFATEVVKKEQSFLKNRKSVQVAANYKSTSFPGHFRAKMINHGDKSFAYIRIFSFATNDPVDFVREFIRLIEQMPAKGLILDVRNNGGGNILAAEWMLQVLTDKQIVPQPEQFINTPLVEELCRLHSPSNIVEGLDLTDWQKTIKEMIKTGSIYSLGYPITSPDSLKTFRAEKQLKLVLITDALCYSAADIFAAGFHDHELGRIIGTSENTGAGGANVWTHALLHHLTREAGKQSKYFRSLPYGSNFRVAIRRTLRVGANTGIPLEDLGVKPDLIHHMTKDDLLYENKDLIFEACNVLIQMQ